VNYIGTLLKVLKNSIWIVIGIIVVAAVGRYLSIRDAQLPEAGPPSEKPIARTIVWNEVDQAVVAAIGAARASTEKFADREIEEWFGELMVRVDTDFLDWYFSYWTQQLLGLEGLWQYGVNSFFAKEPTAAEKLTEEIQEEFANRVLRPQIAELVLQRIVRESAAHYVEELRSNLAVLPDTYKIPRADWDRYLEGIALTTSGTDGNRETNITLKALTLTTAGGTILLVGKMNMLVGKLSGKLMAKSAGKAAGAIAAKTGAKVAAKGGGKFLGPIVGIGVIIWDVWDHNATKSENRPILRRSIADYFAELKDILLHDTENGIMVTFNDLERQVAAALQGSAMPPAR
jgi:hypothetical protein